MKKNLILSILILMTGLNSYAQDINSEGSSLKASDNNEVRFNVATAIFGLPEINYERFITDNMGVGLTVAISLEKPEKMTIRSITMPYYRVYFGDQKASGFFIEGNMAIVGEKEEVNSSVNEYNTATSFGFGAAIGFKLLTRNGVIGEFCLGGGRLFGNSLDEAYPRLGVCIGKRF